MIARTFAAVSEAEGPIASILITIGVSIVAGTGIALIVFGLLWYLPALIERLRRTP